MSNDFNGKMEEGAERRVIGSMFGGDSSINI